MKRFSYAAVICASLLTAPAFAADQAAVDPDLAQFRAAYTSVTVSRTWSSMTRKGTTSIATATRPEWRQRRVLADTWSSRAMRPAS